MLRERSPVPRLTKRRFARNIFEGGRVGFPLHGKQISAYSALRNRASLEAALAPQLAAGSVWCDLGENSTMARKSAQIGLARASGRRLLSEVQRSRVSLNGRRPTATGTGAC